MDLREQDERYSSGQRSRTCAVVLKVLAIIGVVVGFALLPIVISSGDGERSGLRVVSAVVFLFWALATAAFLWAMATLLRSQRHIEENTRELAKMLRPQNDNRREGPAKPERQE